MSKPLPKLPPPSGELGESHCQIMAKAHVDWFLETIRPLLIQNFVHGYKHGQEDSPDDDPAEGPGVM